MHRKVTVPRTRTAPPPPEGVLPPERLARQARAALEGAVRLARWAAETGLSPRAEPAAARAAAEVLGEAAPVPAAWDRARLAGLVELHGEQVRAGWRLRAWERDDAAVLRGWVALFDAWSLAHPPPSSLHAGLAAETVQAVPQFLSVMHLSAGPVSFSLLQELLTGRIEELRAERDPEHPVRITTEAEDALAGVLDWALDGLSGVGALVRCPDEGLELTGAKGGPRQGSAVLTPLGNWAVWTKLEQICVAAQSPAGNIEHAAADMLRGCARLTPGPARAEYRAWLAARPTGPAVTELLDAARGEDPLTRGLAFEALRVVGEPAEGAVQEAAAEPVLRPYALLWLAELAGADPEELAAEVASPHGVLTREEATWLWVDTAAAVADHGEERLLVDHLDTAVQGSVPRLLEEVRASGHPRTVQVLVALAAAHPDPVLAKAVRRAAFQVHTGGE